MCQGCFLAEEMIQSPAPFPAPVRSKSRVSINLVSIKHSDFHTMQDFRFIVLSSWFIFLTTITILCWQTTSGQLSRVSDLRHSKTAKMKPTVWTKSILCCRYLWTVPRLCTACLFLTKQWFIQTHDCWRPRETPEIPILPQELLMCCMFGKLFKPKE